MISDVNVNTDITVRIVRTEILVIKHFVLMEELVNASQITNTGLIKCIIFILNIYIYIYIY